MPYVDDLLELFHRVAEHSHERTRVIVNSYSRVWRPVFGLAELLRLKPRKPLRNWVAPHDVVNLLELAGFEPVLTRTRILFPKQIPFLTTFLNGFVGSLPLINLLAVTNWIVARPLPRELGPKSVSIVCACRNEQGHIAELIDRVPDFGVPTELIFVEGNSTDDTRGEILRQIEAHPDRDISFVPQTGKGKGDAVRTGFAAAKHDVLMILDGDLSVLPEDLPKFHRGLVDGRAELVNGSRLVYDMEPGAMRFLNMIGNRIFARLLKGIIGQQVKDTLCGTKVLLKRGLRPDRRRAAPTSASSTRSATSTCCSARRRLGLKIVDLPVRYHPRTYGETNISRWRHGVLLLQMTLFAFWKFRVAPLTRRGV